VLLALHQGKKINLLSQINNAEMVDTSTIKTQSLPINSLQGSRSCWSAIITQLHTQKIIKKRDILLSLELASQTLTSHTTKQVPNFLYRINLTKGKTSTTISHPTSPFWKTVSEHIIIIIILINCTWVFTR
jgi:hypothetical protein